MIVAHNALKSPFVTAARGFRQGAGHDRRFITTNQYKNKYRLQYVNETQQMFFDAENGFRTPPPLRFAAFARLLPLRVNTFV